MLCYVVLCGVVWYGVVGVVGVGVGEGIGGGGGEGGRGEGAEGEGRGGRRSGATCVSIQTCHQDATDEEMPVAPVCLLVFGATWTQHPPMESLLTNEETNQTENVQSVRSEPTQVSKRVEILMHKISLPATW